MSDNTANNKRIAKNSIALYVRMLFYVVISLYTSRMVLSILGVEDFGIYNIVGGVVTLMGFLKASMSSVTGRFLTFNLGKGDFVHLRKTFNAAMQIHIFIAIITFIIGEIIGVWFVNCQLDIPDVRLYAANWVFQFSLLTMVVSLIQVPYTATLQAHERLDVYAIIEIVNVSLRLGIVYFLLATSFDKLIFYSFLLLCVSIVILLVSAFYCIKKFRECNLNREINRSVIRPILSFSIWDLYSNGSIMARQQGTNILLNMFFGVALNAANGIATQASSAVSVFVSNITVALRPQLIKRYASEDYVGLQKLLSMALIICMVLLECILIPLYLNIDSIMSLWLGEVPIYATSFTRFLLIANTFSAINSIFTAIIYANGKIKQLSIFSGSMHLSTVIISYILFLFFPEPTIAYWVWCIITFVVMIVNILIVKNKVPTMSLRSVFNQIRLPILAVAISIAVSCYINSLFSPTISRFGVIFLANILIIGLSIYAFWLLPYFKGNIKRAFKEFS